MEVGKTAEFFLINYLAFISIYEIGYIINDFYAVKREADGRERVSKFQATSLNSIILISFRFLVFSGITFQYEKWKNEEWIIFYMALLFCFAIHNLIVDKGLKIVTFVGLATFRISAVTFAAIPTSLFTAILPSLLLCYVLFRLLSYMESKGILHIKNRRSNKFRLLYFLYLFPLTIPLSFVFQSYLPVLINAYYLFISLFFAGSALLKSKEMV